jgi:3-hydroxyacyl-[acyl-carrier-protein] dehydratase
MGPRSISAAPAVHETPILGWEQPSWLAKATNFLKIDRGSEHQSSSGTLNSTAMSEGLDPDILQQVRAILRRDLKLEPDAPLPEEMPFFGGEVDLDSLDMLLLVTSIERQFGVGIPNEAVGRQAFANVASLARYVQENHGSRKLAPNPPTPGVDYLSHLPHGEPFRFVSRVSEVVPGVSARGAWSLSGSEAFFAGHFPGRPLVPGVLIAEALAQISGIAGPPGSPPEGKLVHADIRFDNAATPPVEIELIARLVRVLGNLQQFDVVAQVGQKVLARGSLSLYRGNDGGSNP